jgi:hypothetical protein
MVTFTRSTRGGCTSAALVFQQRSRKSSSCVKCASSPRLVVFAAHKQDAYEPLMRLDAMWSIELALDRELLLGSCV